MPAPRRGGGGGARRPNEAPSRPPRKRFGQHFLRDRAVLERIADAVGAGERDVVVEIGPGRGALTDLLARRAGRLVAVEIDRDLAAELRVRYDDTPSVTIVEGDVLAHDLGALAGSDEYLLAGNVPYYITTPIIFQALRAPRPRRAVYLVQREVAERVIAPPGGKEYGALSVNVQGFATAEIVARVPPRAFSPPPRVDSAVLRVVPRADPVVAADEERRFRAFVQQAFGMRRKQMRRVVRAVASLPPGDAEAALSAAGIDPDARPETLTPYAFAALIRALGQASG